MQIWENNVMNLHVPINPTLPMTNSRLILLRLYPTHFYLHHHLIILKQIPGIMSFGL